jgi:cyclopropane fatty-acyl-phospholipid synthase-like methyltransferase
LKLENVCGIDFEKDKENEDYVKKLRCPIFDAFDFDHQLVRENIGNLLEKKDIKVLEIGCGWGRNAQYFKNKENAKYYAFDPSETSLLYFSKLQLPKERFYTSQEIDDVILGQKYDFIFSTYVLQHIGWPNPPQNSVVTIIDEILPCFKEDGMMMFFELNQGQNGWAPAKFVNIMESKGLKTHNCGAFSIDKGNDPHDLMFLKWR